MIDTAAIPFATKAASSTAHKRRFGQKLTSVTLAVVIITTVTAQPAGYGERLLPAPKCLTSRSTVSGVGRMQFCLDVEGPATTGQKVVVSVTTPRPTDIVLFGERALPISSADQSSSSSSIIGPIIEIKPFEQSCETCDFCPCLGPGCGTRCECSCNVMCRLRREATCAHTAGVLTPGRWFVSVDAPGAFTLEATLVGALVLSPGAPALRRTVFAAGAPAGTSAFASSTSEGVAFADYLYYDPKPHESLRVQIDLLRSGPGGGFIDVYVRFGEWPTVQQHDAAMHCDSAANPTAMFMLQHDRLFNERLNILVLGRGNSWAQYEISARAAASLPFLLAIGLVVLVVLVALIALGRILVRQRRGRAAAAAAEAKPIAPIAGLRGTSQLGGRGAAGYGTAGRV